MILFRQPGSVLHLHAPAKLNLDLYITGQRTDGYHLLDSLFVPIGLYDTLTFYPERSGSILLDNPVAGLRTEDDLCYRAAALLKQHTDCKKGIRLYCRKRIPTGAGMGGGSSDAALVLAALNVLWRCGLPPEELASLGLSLGADVPFFLTGKPARVRGIGEAVKPLELPRQWFVIVKPDIHLSTATVFASRHLTRNSDTGTIAVSQRLKQPRNDLQDAVFFEYPEVKKVYDALALFGLPLMTGSGSCLFLRFERMKDAQSVYRKVSPQYRAFCVPSLPHHPFYKELGLPLPG